MSSWERQLISRIIRSGDFTTVAESGISTSDFKEEACKAIFGMIEVYYRAHKSVWGPNALAQKFPHFTLSDDPSMQTEALIAELRIHRARLEGMNIIRYAESELDSKDPFEVLQEAEAKLKSLQEALTLKSTDMTLAEGLQRVKYRYDLQQQGVTTSVMAWPWQYLQQATLGVQDEDYIIIYGRPKNMKTWVLCTMIAAAFDQGKKMLVYTKEMTSESLIKRIVSILLKINMDDWKTKLPDDKYQGIIRMIKMAEILVAHQRLVVLGADKADGKDTVGWLSAKIERYQPDIVFIDGMYLMSTAGKHGKDFERVAQISKDLRQIPLKYRTPIVCTLQANRAAAKNKKANLDEVAFSDQLGMDTTLAIRCIKEKDTETGSPLISLVTNGAARECNIEGFRINGMPAVDFSFHSHLTEDAVKDAEKKCDRRNNVKKNADGSYSPTYEDPSAHFDDLFEDSLNAVEADEF